jgi:hypothetical protein
MGKYHFSLPIDFVSLVQPTGMGYFNFRQNKNTAKRSWHIGRLYANTHQFLDLYVYIPQESRKLQEDKKSHFGRMQP